MKRLATLLALLALVAGGAFVVRKQLHVSSAHAVEADAHDDQAAGQRKRAHRLPPIPSFKDLPDISSIPKVQFTEAKLAGKSPTEIEMRGNYIRRFHEEFIPNNNVTPQQERLLMALMADIEDDIHAAKDEEMKLRHGPIHISRDVYDKLGPEKTKELVYEEAERRSKDAQDLSDSAREAIQKDYDERAAQILTPEQFLSWKGYDLDAVVTLDIFGPFTESSESQ